MAYSSSACASRPCAGFEPALGLVMADRADGDTAIGVQPGAAPRLGGLVEPAAGDLGVNQRQSAVGNAAEGDLGERIRGVRLRLGQRAANHQVIARMWLATEYAGAAPRRRDQAITSVKMAVASSSISTSISTVGTIQKDAASGPGVVDQAAVPENTQRDQAHLLLRAGHRGIERGVGKADAGPRRTERAGGRVERRRQGREAAPASRLLAAVKHRVPCRNSPSSRSDSGRAWIASVKARTASAGRSVRVSAVPSSAAAAARTVTLTGILPASDRFSTAVSMSPAASALEPSSSVSSGVRVALRWLCQCAPQVRRGHIRGAALASGARRQPQHVHGLAVPARPGREQVHGHPIGLGARGQLERSRAAVPLHALARPQLPVDGCPYQRVFERER